MLVKTTLGLNINPGSYPYYLYHISIDLKYYYVSILIFGILNGLILDFILRVKVAKIIKVVLQLDCNF